MKCSMPQLLLKLGSRPSRVHIPCGNAAPKVALQQFLRSGILPVHFPETSGGTHLDVLLAPGSELPDEGRARFTGDLVLDDVPVRAVIELDLNTMTGSGLLQLLQDA